MATKSPKNFLSIHHEKLLAEWLPKDWSEQERKELCQLFELKSLQDQEIFIEEGDPVLGFAIVVEGELTVLKRDLNQNRQVAVTVLHPGDCFAEGSLLDPIDSPCTIISEQSSKLLFLDEILLDEHEDSEVVEKLLDYLEETCPDQAPFIKKNHQRIGSTPKIEEKNESDSTQSESLNDNDDDNQGEDGEQHQENRSVFRFAAVDHYSSASHFEHPFLPIGYKKWVVQGSLLIVGIAATIWFFLGTLPVETEGVGIVVNVEGLSNIETSFNGVVKNLNVRSGEFVNKGQLLAVLSNPEVETRLNMAMQIIENLNQRIVNLQQEVEIERVAEKNVIAEEIAAATYKMNVLEREIPLLSRDVRNKEELLARGLFESQNLQDSKEMLWSKQTDLQRSQVHLTHLNFSLIKGHREQEIEALREHLFVVSQEMHLLEAQLKTQHIYSPAAGVILEVFIHPNKYVAEGDLIARLEIQQGENRQKIFYGYLPVEVGAKIRQNAEVAIELTTARAQEHGAILGNIVSISPYPVSIDSLTRTINNPALIRHFLQENEAVVEVVIVPQVDSKTVSGYRWTSGDGPPIQLTSGTLCSFKGLVEEVHPYLQVLPMWWLKQWFHPENTPHKNPSSLLMHEST